MMRVVSVDVTSIRYQILVSFRMLSFSIHTGGKETPYRAAGSSGKDPRCSLRSRPCFARSSWAGVSTWEECGSPYVRTHRLRKPLSCRFSFTIDSESSASDAVRFRR